MNGYPPASPGHGEEDLSAEVTAGLPDPLDDPDLREVAVVVRDVLHEHRMRPAARDQLRARLVAAATAQALPAGDLPAEGPAGHPEARPGGWDSRPAGQPGER
ncbi:MAG TPA: hypothetical protein VFP72_16445, partial [Kineosporiaceae bacterium]|nr:hypothetical protein [Kineosporiaceae bacterium]